MAAVLDTSKTVERCDVATLRAPRVLDSGTVIFDVVVATADEPLRYSHGVEFPTEEALSDPEHIKALVGMPVLIEDHPPGKRVVNGDTGGVRTVGTVVEARWDAPSRQLIAGLAVHQPADQQRAREIGSVSEAYSATVDAQGRQTSRTPNHMTIGHGRAQSAQIRADQEESTVTEEQFKQLMEALGALSSKIDGMAPKDDKADAMAEAKADADAEVAEVKADADEKVAAAEIKATEAEERADKAEKSVEARAQVIAEEISNARKRADTLKVEVPDTAKTPLQILTAIAVDLGCPADRADTIDKANAWIDATESAAKRADTKAPTEAERLAGSARADTNTDHII